MSLSESSFFSRLASEPAYKPLNEPCVMAPKAWDAADAYLLDSIQEHYPEARSILVLNDRYGALSVCLRGRITANYTDSFVAKKTIRLTLEGSGLSQSETASLSFIHAVTDLEDYVSKIDLIVGRIPKSKAQLRYLLDTLRRGAAGRTPLMLAGMDKHLSKGQLQIVSECYGDTKFLPGVKKARVWWALSDPALTPEPVKFSHFRLPDRGLSFVSAPNVFSQEKLDIGTRFLLEHLEKVGGYEKVIDLACGNGVIGMAYLADNQKSELLFLDESYQAIESTAKNLKSNGFETRARAMCADGLLDQKPGSADLVLCNPPFHQGHSISNDLGKQMIRQSHKALSDQGVLCLVANRHLNYHTELKRIFGHSELVASNSKFVILRARKI